MNDQPVVVESFRNRIEADLARGVLESAGIPAFVSADDCGGFRPELQVSTGAQVLVAQHNLERARTILRDYSQATEE